MTRFIDKGGARGHESGTVEKLVEVSTNRRWQEENQTYREMYGASLSPKQRIFEKSERKQVRHRIISELREMSPRDFEKLVADIFQVQGLTAMVVGGSFDDGVDVKIWDKELNLWAVAQCKRYRETNIVGARQIREFAGAFAMSKAERGFFFTTSDFSRHAKKTARGFPWLTIYNGHRFTEYIRRLNVEFAMCDSNSILDDNFLP